MIFEVSIRNFVMPYNLRHRKAIFWPTKAREARRIQNWTRSPAVAFFLQVLHYLQVDTRHFRIYFTPATGAIPDSSWHLVQHDTPNIVDVATFLTLPIFRCLSFTNHNFCSAPYHCIIVRNRLEGTRHFGNGAYEIDIPSPPGF